jgi:2-(1,2-epoxy-1,2-dihydrophenyl)acetyl-CoA isomerase
MSFDPSVSPQGYETLVYEERAPVATITFNRPEKRNALTVRFFEELLAVLQHVEATDELRVVVLAGNGPAFCAGRDFSEAKAADPASAAYYLRLNLEGRERLRRFPKPVIARVHGPASGGGCMLATECADITIASPGARFSIREVQAGSVPSLPLLTLGRARALGMVLTGDWVSGEQAQEWGLVYKCVPDDELDATVARYAEQLAAQPAVAMTYAKRAMCFLMDLAGHAQTEQFLAESRKIVQQSPDRAAALTSFLDKTRR